MESSSVTLTKEELAVQLKVSTKTIERAIKGGTLPAIKVGRCVRIRQVDAEAYLKNNTTQQK